MTELEAWLRLWHIPKVGPKTFNFILGKFPNLNELFTCSYTDLLNLAIPDRIALAITDNLSKQYKNDISWLHSQEDNRITLLNQPLYPTLLKSINDPPPLIYSRGDIELFSIPATVSIVGGRSASSFGKRIAFDLAQELASIGLIIVSGLARGIDGQAHKGALAANSRSTIAVLANGLDTIYPSEHTHLAREVCQESLLISEFAPGVKPLPHHFPRRNRIISGLSLGTLVIEAANKSGSLITAKFALEQGREVFAVPGSINNPQNDGCHHLIQQGAKLTTKIEDILIEIATGLEDYLKTEDTRSNNKQELTDLQTKILSHIEFTPISVDKIIEKSGLTPEQVSSMLTELEIGGYVAADAFGQYCRI